VTYNSFIVAAGKANQFVEAKATYGEAKRLRLADVVTHNSFINAAGKANQFVEAKAAFEEAKRKSLADAITYSSFIDAAGKANQFVEAKAAFEEAKRNGLVDAITYGSFINALVVAKDYHQAIDLFKTTYPNFNPAKIIQDFHGFNFGKTYIACMLIFDKPREVNLIIGKGSHSEGESVVKQAVEQFCHERGALIESDRFNKGMVICRYAPHVAGTLAVSIVAPISTTQSAGESTGEAEEVQQVARQLVEQKQARVEMSQEARQRRSQRKAAQRKRHAGVAEQQASATEQSTSELPDEQQNMVRAEEPHFGLNKACMTATVFACAAIGGAAYYYFKNAEELCL
jgi:pentatricopeptide repeat protein